MSWRGTAIAPEGNSSRESAIDGVIERGGYFEASRIVLDRSFESEGFHGVPFSIEHGDQDVLVIESEQASLAIALDIERLGDELSVVESFVPHFYLDTEVPGVSKDMRYTLVCKGGTGRVRAARDGEEVRGDLAITVACRTYVDGSERDESEIALRGEFRAPVR